MDANELISGHPNRQRYYDKLIKSDKMNGKVICEHRDTSGHFVNESIGSDNPFVTSQSSEVQMLNRRGWLDSAIKSRSNQELKSSRRSLENGHYKDSVQSDYLQNLYKKYPHTFHRKNPKDSRNAFHRPSRRMFSPGLRVHFDDQVHYNDDTQSVSSERPPVTKWDREMERILGHHHTKSRSCLTSPTPSMISDFTVTSSRIHSPFNRLSHHVDNDLDNYNQVSSHQSSRRTSISEQNSLSHDHIELLEQELEMKQKQLQSFKRQLELQQRLPNSDAVTLLDSPNWRVLSPDSPSDSAIDLDSSSVQSSSKFPLRFLSADSSCDTHKSRSLLNFNQINRSHSTETPPNEYRFGRRYFPMEAAAYDLQSNGSTEKSSPSSSSYKDSDVDSGIVQSGVLMKFDFPQNVQNRDFVHVSGGRSNVSRRPASAIDFSRTRYYSESNISGHQTDFRRTRNYSESNAGKTDRKENSDDDSIVQEILKTNIRLPLNDADIFVTESKNEEEVDDTDPRLGLPPILEDEQFIKRQYQKRRKPSPFVIVRGKSLTARPQSAPIFGKSNSDDTVSVLCTPRKKQEGLKFNPCDVDFPNSKEKHLNVSESKSESFLSKQSEPSFLFNNMTGSNCGRKLEHSIRKHSRKTSLSSESSDISETTLVASQLTLNEDKGNVCTVSQNLKDFSKEETNEKLQHVNNSQEEKRSIEINTNKSTVHLSNDTGEIKIQKKLLKESSSSDYEMINGHDDSDDGSSHSSEDERVSPYEISVLKMNKQGGNDDIFSAKPITLTVPKGQTSLDRPDKGTRKLQSKSPATVTELIPPVSLSRESSASLPETLTSEHSSISSEMSSNSYHNSNASPHKNGVLDKESNKHVTAVQMPESDYATVEPNEEICLGEELESPSHVYAKVKHINKQSEETIKRKQHTNDQLTVHSTEEGDVEKTTYTSGDGITGAESFTNSGSRIKLNRKVSQSTPDVSMVSQDKSCEIDLATDEGPPLPVRNYGSTTNLSKSKELSGSRISLSNKMSNFKAAAKTKFKSLRKAVSMDKGINKTQGEINPSAMHAETVTVKPPKANKGIHKTRGEIQPAATLSEPALTSKPPKPRKGISLKKLFGKKSSKHRSTDNMYHGALERFTTSASDQDKDSVEVEAATSVGKLKEILPDGTQIVELHRPPKGPIGFFISRGSTQFKHGIFVSRFSEECDVQRFAGLLNIGDEILEINGQMLENASLDDVYDLMANQSAMELRILPLLARDDFQ